jgi:hypothetical protein
MSTITKTRDSHNHRLPPVALRGVDHWFQEPSPLPSRVRRQIIRLKDDPGFGFFTKRLHTHVLLTLVYGHPTQRVSNSGAVTYLCIHTKTPEGKNALEVKLRPAAESTAAAQRPFVLLPGLITYNLLPG